MSYGPSKHAHMQMVWREDVCWCEGCGQRWELKSAEDRAGKVLWKWVWVPGSARF